MKFKIFNLKGHKSCKQVSVAIVESTETGDQYIEVQAWVLHDGCEWFRLEEIHCDNTELIQCVFNEFSEKSAIAFVDSHVKRLKEEFPEDK